MVAHPGRALLGAALALGAAVAALAPMPDGAGTSRFADEMPIAISPPPATAAPDAEPVGTGPLSAARATRTVQHAVRDVTPLGPRSRGAGTGDGPVYL